MLYRRNEAELENECRDIGCYHPSDAHSRVITPSINKFGNTVLLSRRSKSFINNELHAAASVYVGAQMLLAYIHGQNYFIMDFNVHLRDFITKGKFALSTESLKYKSVIHESDIAISLTKER